MIHAFKGCSDIPACLVLENIPPIYYAVCSGGLQDALMSKEAEIVKPLFFSTLVQT